MTSFMEFIFSSFWIFLGFLCILGIVAYALSNLKFVTIVKENHNETYPTTSLSDEDKTFISEMSYHGLDSFTKVMMLDDINKLVNPDVYTLYLIKDEDMEGYYKMITFDPTTNSLTARKMVNFVSVH